MPADPLGLGTRLAPREAWRAPTLAWLLALDEAGWQRATLRSALRRARHRQLAAQRPGRGGQLRRPGARSPRSSATREAATRSSPSTRAGRSRGSPLARGLGERARPRSRARATGPSPPSKTPLLVEPHPEPGKEPRQLARREQKRRIPGADGRLASKVPSEGLVEQQAARREELGEGGGERPAEVAEDQHRAGPAGREGQGARRALEVCAHEPDAAARRWRARSARVASAPRSRSRPMQREAARREGERVAPRPQARSSAGPSGRVASRAASCCSRNAEGGAPAVTARRRAPRSPRGRGTGSRSRCRRRRGRGAARISAGSFMVQTCTCTSWAWANATSSRVTSGRPANSAGIWSAIGSGGGAAPCERRAHEADDVAGAGARRAVASPVSARRRRSRAIARVVARGERASASSRPAARDRARGCPPRGAASSRLISMLKRASGKRLEGLGEGRDAQPAAAEREAARRRPG